MSKFEYGERVQLSDAKGNKHTLVLTPEKVFHTHKGAISHDDIVQLSDGSKIVSTNGTEYLLLRPLLLDHILAMPRGAAVIYPRDSATILIEGDIFPGATVLEAGVGSGGLSSYLLRAIGSQGKLISVERRADFAENAAANITAFFGEKPTNWSIEVGDLQAYENPALIQNVDRIILDMLAPWECTDKVFEFLKPGGVLVAYVATTTQLSKTVELLRLEQRWTEPRAFETLTRGWHLEGLSVRPEHRMVGHTGFLLTTRRLADGVAPFKKRSKPAPGAYGPDWVPPSKESAASE